MSVVTETVLLPTGVPPESVAVELFLAGEDGVPYPAGYASAADETFVGRLVFQLDADGSWSQDLPGNTLITPAGTRWGVRLSAPASARVSTVPRFLLVPATGGPFVVEDILSDPPGVILDPDTAAGLSDRIGDVEADVADLPNRYLAAPDDTPTTGQVVAVLNPLATPPTTQWVDQTGGGGGGGGTVDSVVAGHGIDVDSTDPANPVVAVDESELTGLASSTDLTAEAVLARNADNLTSGTVADARIASTIARDTEVAAAVLVETNARIAADSALDADLDAQILSLSEDVAEALGEVQASVDGLDDDLDAETAARAAAISGLSAVYQPVDAGLTALAAAGNSATLTATTAAFTTAKDTKLSGIATAATANDTDANLKNRANHTGTQLLATISDAGTAAAANTGTGAANVPTITQADARYERLILVTALKTANYSVNANEYVPFDTTSGALIATLPTAPADGTQVILKRVAGTNLVTYNCGGSDVLNVAGGSTSGTLQTIGHHVVLTYKTSVAIWYVETSFSKSGLDSLYAALTSVSTLSVNTQTGTTYTLVLGDAGLVVRCTNASAVTLTVPPNSSVAFPVGTVLNVYAAGAGGTTIAAGAGVTIRNNSAALAQYAEASLRKDATDEWVRLG